MEEQQAKEIIALDSEHFPILAVLFPDELHFFRSIAEVVEIAADVPVIAEGQQPQHLFFVHSGMLRVNKRYEQTISEVATITPGEIFGEASILHAAPAAAEVRTVEQTVLYRIPREQALDVIGTNERFARSLGQLAERRLAATALAVNPIFATLPQAVRETIIYNGQFINLEKGEELVHEGDADTRVMYVVLNGTGEASLQHPNDPHKQIVFARISSGDEVGEISVITGRPHAATVTATSDMRLMAINNDAVQAWRTRHSDFGYALYACVQRKLHHSLEAMRNVVDEQEARARTVDTLPPPESGAPEEG